MSPDERTTLEARAERCVRRGELSEAFRLFRELAAAFPDDQALAQHITEVEGSLQAGELMSARANFKAEPTGAPVSATEHAEQLAAAGDYAGAIAGYRKLLTERPDNELVKERVDELYALARAAAPRPSAPTRHREAVLGELLSRIDARRRP